MENPMSQVKKTIAVFCGRDYGKNKEVFKKMAMDTGQLLAKHNFITATGGGIGMMSDVNQGAYEAKGKVISIQFTSISETQQSPYFTEKQSFKDLIERQKTLVSLADGMIVLPGGIGTLYEAVEVITLKRTGTIPMKKPLLFVNLEYYDPIRHYISRAIEEGFISHAMDDLCSFVNTPNEAVLLLQDTLYEQNNS